jgi:hypothetical protein
LWWLRKSNLLSIIPALIDGDGLDLIRKKECVWK